MKCEIAEKLLALWKEAGRKRPLQPSIRMSEDSGVRIADLYPL
jgi:hypothetical protein